MKLVPICEYENCHKILYDLLLEREGEKDINISHGETPSYEDHCHFIECHPYQAWYFIFVEDACVGSIYLTIPPLKSVSGNEIGVFIFKKHQGKGYAGGAIELLIKKHPYKKYLANINPNNVKSINLFEKIGFELCQLTFEKREK